MFIMTSGNKQSGRTRKTIIYLVISFWIVSTHILYQNQLSVPLSKVCDEMIHRTMKQVVWWTLGNYYNGFDYTSSKCIMG